jgi:RNA polymerase-binding protein DksA
MMKIKRVMAITTAESRHRKMALASKLRELLDVSREREELRIEYLADPTDQVRSNTDREMTVQRLDHQTRLIHYVQSALVKIEDGVYGLCERCEEPIPRKRLDAVPWARLCVPCQSEVEVAERDRKPPFADAA